MNTRGVLTCWFAIALGAAVFAEEQGAVIPFAQLPPAVQKGIQAQLGNGKLGGITREEENGAVTYLAEITKGGKTRDYSLDESGALVGMEMTLPETPAAVQKTILAQIGQGTIETIDKSIDGDAVSYDVVWKSKEGATHAFSVLESGKPDSVDVTLEETPPAVKAVIGQEIGKGKLTRISKSFEDDGVYYDVTVNQNGADRDFSVQESGQMESRQVLFSELSPAVQATIQRTVGGGKIVRIDQLYEKRKGRIPFEVESVVNGKPYYFLVGPKGAFLGADE